MPGRQKSRREIKDSTGAGRSRVLSNRHMGPGAKTGSNKQCILCVVFIIVVAAIVTALVLLLGGDGTSEKRLFEKMACKEESPLPIHVNECKKSECTFDLTLCPEECPFGYTKDDTGCEDSCECSLDGMFEGDIHVTKEQMPALSWIYGYMDPEEDFNIYGGSATVGALWNDKQKGGRHEIGYTIVPTMPHQRKLAIEKGIRTFSEKTCIDFVEWKHHDRYFKFTHDRGCSSMVGRVRNGQQVSIAKGCHLLGTVQHELLHLLGFYHEHSRPDRDAYLQILNQNINPKAMGNFQKRSRKQVRHLKSEYDVNSIMQYPSHAFTKNGKSTILERSTGNKIKGQRVGFTEEDLYEVNLLYKCFGLDKDSPAWNQWTPWSVCDATCGVGERRRFRKCLKNRKTVVSGCVGEENNRAACMAPPCPPLTGKWGSWSSYNKCSQPCDIGYQWRRRKCPDDEECEGVSYHGRPCGKNPCKPGVWSQWLTWTTCTQECGGGTRYRTRQCKGGAGVSCRLTDKTVGKKETVIDSCNEAMCDEASSPGTSWTTWTPCSAPCNGFRTRKKLCSGQPCEDTPPSKERCNTKGCGQGSMFDVKGTTILGTSKNCDAAKMELWVFGDFDGDGKVDVVCPDRSRIFRIHHATGSASRWSGRFPECVGNMKITADLNEDRKDDILCRDTVKKKLFVSYADKKGTFSDSAFAAGSFCAEKDSKPFVLPSSKKNVISLACHYKNNDLKIQHGDGKAG